MRNNNIYVRVLLMLLVVTGINMHAQHTDSSGNGDVINAENPVNPGYTGNLDIRPGMTIRPDDSRGDWTEDMYREWYEEIRRYNDAVAPPRMSPVIDYPDFTKMNSEQIKEWQDSILNVLYPRLETVHYDKETGKYVVSTEENGIANENITLRSGYTNYSVPTTATIDKNRIVGEIPYSTATLPNGAVTYSVPVEAYPGINGFQPDISLVYNSHAGNSIAGVGWSIGGLSAITRTAKNIYYNGKPEGVLMDKNDPFVLDGIRLIKLSETSSLMEYETERGNIKVNAYLQSGVIRYFEVKYPNGSVGTYGYTNNYSNSYHSYPLTQLKDRFNNIITYMYEYWDNHYTITEIHYANASILFHYESIRTDK